MPDWSYQTVFRPILFRLPPAKGRDSTLGVMGTLSRFPLGNAVIEFLGHMTPDARLRHTAGGMEFAGPVGLGACVDARLLAPGALSRMGVAFLEVGPFSPNSEPGGPIELDAAAEELVFHSCRENPGLDAAVRALERIDHVPIFVRLPHFGREPNGFEQHVANVVQRLGARAAGFILDIHEAALALDPLERLREQLRALGGRTLLVAVPAAAAEHVASTVSTLFDRGLIVGVVINGYVEDDAGRRLVGRATFPAALQAVRTLRSAVPRGAILIASGGVHEPLQALQLMDAGCNLVAIDSGMIFSGPGLAKRIHEAVLHRSEQSPAPAAAAIADREQAARPARQSWFWTTLIGASMFAGGLMALVIAVTRVVMPYDEAMVGLTRDEIAAVNDRLLHFMTHDRVTLSGTMLSVGVLYLVLSLCGSRRGIHWSHAAIVASALAGFASFFLFLGFGYFDPFHAFVTAVLLQFLLLAIHSDLPQYRNPVPPELTNDRAWRLSQWGQLAFIGHGAVLIVAGCVISSFGITRVFVPEDLEFLGTTAERLFQSHPRLVPLVAHDRATFGGMLIACGVCVFLSSLWGFRRGHAWLWWALVVAGSIAYVLTILVHWHVGYTSLMHLLPAYAGLGMIVVGGALSRPHLCATDRSRTPSPSTAASGVANGISSGSTP